MNINNVKNIVNLLSTDFLLAVKVEKLVYPQSVELLGSPRSTLLRLGPPRSTLLRLGPPRSTLLLPLWSPLLLLLWSGD